MTQPQTHDSTSGSALQALPDPWPAILAHLWRGGAWGYYWTLPDKVTHWRPVANPGPAPRGQHVYYGVHPANERGLTTERAKIGDLAAVNCVYGEFDDKDHGGDHTATLAHVDGLAVIPSVIVDSGGGYHCYWLLASPFIFAEQADRERARLLQAAWTRYVGSDGGAKDLARVLRVPGTLNSKYDPPRPVKILRADLARLYTIGDLETVCKPPEARPAPMAGNGNGRGPSENAGQYWLDKALAQAHVGNRNATGFWLATQLRDDGMTIAEAEGWLLAYARSVPQTSGDYYAEAAALASLKSAYGGAKREPAKSATARTKPQRSAPTASPKPSPTEEQPPAWPADNELQEAPPAATIGTGAEHFTDLGNARRLVRLHGQDLRYCYPWAKWLIWDGERWAPDDTGEAPRRAKASIAGMYAAAAAAPDDETRKALARHALKCESANRITSMLALAESEPSIPVLPGQLDADPWLINVLNGTLDLRAFELRPHDRSNLLTKLAPVIYDPSATCPTWEAFLQRVMGGDADLIGFLQRIAGYSLTGDTSEQVLFLLYGSGANGKSTFLETLRAMIGEEYALQLRPEALMIRKGETVPNDIARLKGARLVSARETEEGKRMAEALVKELTGGDTITARFLRQEYFDFRPEFKLFLAANHKPVIRGTDYAVWRRIKLIPFTVTIPPEEQDKALGRKLLGELDGIFAWAVRGCLAWQRDGLQVPAAVEAATSAYKAESDTLAAFLAECTTQDGNAETQASKLYAAYKSWCEDNGEMAITGTMFGRRLGERGYDKYTDRARHTFYMGLALLASAGRE